MKRYLIYDAYTGEIKGAGVCQACDFEANARDNAIVEGTGDANTHYVKDGQPFEYTEQQRISKSARPFGASTWDNDRMEWNTHDVAVILGSAKGAKWGSVKAARDAMALLPLEFDSVIFDADEKSQRLIAGAIQLAVLAPNDWTIDWTLRDNSVRTLTKLEIIQLGVALGQRTADVYSRSQILRAQINAAETINEVNAIEWGQE